MFISAGNDGPGTNTIGDPGVVSKVMGVGAYIHRDTWRRNYGSDSPVRRQPASVQLAWTGGGRRAQAADRGSGRGDLFGADVAERPARGRDVHPAARVRHVQRHVDGLTTGRRRRRLADQRRQAGASRARLRRGSAPHGVQLDRPLHRPLQRVRPGQRPDRRRQGLEAPEEGRRSGQHQVARGRAYAAQRLPRGARLRPGDLRSRRRYASGSVTPARTRSRAPQDRTTR